MFDKTVQNGDISMKFSLTSGDVTLTRDNQEVKVKGTDYLAMTYPALDQFMKNQNTPKTTQT